MIRKLFLAPLLILFVIGCGSAVSGPKLSPPSQRSAAPEVGGYFLNRSSALNLEKLRGQVVLLNFWATWCGPCRAEIPSLVDLYRTYHPKGVEFLALSVEIDNNVPRGVFDKFLTNNDMIYPVGLASDKTTSDYGINAIPSSFFIDREGRVAASFVGLHSEGDFIQVLNRLLAEPAPNSK
ncbi:MAG: TlpA family protein disulfide reductase [bacterium]